MNEQRHTPGPWKYSPYHRAVLQDERSRDGCCLSICDMVKSPLKVNEPNARLIASAPALLVALRGVVATLDQPVQYTGTTTEGTALILRGDATAARDIARTALEDAEGGGA